MEHMSKERRGYLSYLIRLWQVKNAGKLVWRASIENPSSGERRGFAGLDDLSSFLHRQISLSPDTPHARDISPDRGGDENRRE